MLFFPAIWSGSHIQLTFPKEVIGLGFTLRRRNMRCRLHDTFGFSRHSLTELTRTVPRKRGLPGSSGHDKQFHAKSFNVARHAVHIKRRVVRAYVVCGLCCVIALQRLRSVAGDKNQQRGIWNLDRHKSCNKTRSRVKTPLLISNLCIWATGDFFHPRVKFVCTFKVVCAAR